MKKIICTIILFGIINISVRAVDFDASVDEEIRKNYDVEESTLPPLPNEEPSEYTQTNSTAIEKNIQYNPIGKEFTLKSGTKVNLTSKSVISDRMPQGSKVSFSSTHGILTKEGKIIPAGTIFKGTITDSHTPQITGNGGLVELKIDEIYFNGVKSRINTKVSFANSKKVFLSNIKGKRQYWSNFSKNMTFGKKAFKASQNCAGVMASVPIINLISFVPLLGGTVLYAANLAVAPVITIFSKGGRVYIPVNTEFEIKFTENDKING